MKQRNIIQNMIAESKSKQIMIQNLGYIVIKKPAEIYFYRYLRTGKW